MNKDKIIKNINKQIKTLESNMYMYLKEGDGDNAVMKFYEIKAFKYVLKLIGKEDKNEKTSFGDSWSAFNKRS